MIVKGKAKFLLIIMIFSLHVTFLYSKEVLFSSGITDFTKKQDWELRIQYLNFSGIHKVSPLIGFDITSKGSKLFHMGVAWKYWDNSNYYAVLSFSPGIYSKGDGKDLGAPVQFKSQIEINKKLTNRSSAGLAISHISNASLADINPGINSFVLQYSYMFS